MKKFIKNNLTQIKIVGALAFGSILLTIIYYYFIPLTLNYPKGTFATNFQVELENTNYNIQVGLIAICIFTFSIVLTLLKTSFIPKCQKIINNPENYTVTEINQIKNKLLKTPFELLILHIVIPSFILTIVHSYTINQFGITTLKLFIFIVSLMTLYVTMIYIYETHLFKQLLFQLPYDSIEGIKRTKFSSRIFSNILPLFIVSILFLALVGYSHLSKEKRDLINSKYYTTFETLYSNTQLTKEEALEKLSKIPIDSSSYKFYMTQDGKFYNLDGDELQFSNFFKKYLNELSDQNNGIVYEYYGYDSGASIKRITTTDGQELVIGVYYYIISMRTLVIYSITIIVLICINYVIFYIFAMSTTSELNIINNSFENIIKHNEAQFEKLPLLSSDEFGKLTLLYNQIQELNEKHIKQINANQEILMERERLASLGQLISGIAHNLKTPIMSISGSAQKIEDLITEYSQSITDKEVTIEDHLEIAKDMQEDIEKIKQHVSYMSDIISTVKGQAVSMTGTSNDYFTISELLKKVNILLKHELKQKLTYLNISLNIDEKVCIKGDINALIQVLNNIISNAIEAYEDTQNNIIELVVSQIDDNVEFRIKDYGKPIPESIQDKLFKEMITTKGKNGTGLGLYISYSIIKGHFDGNISLVSNDEFTEFIITIPLKTKD